MFNKTGGFNLKSQLLKKRVEKRLWGQTDIDETVTKSTQIGPNPTKPNQIRYLKVGIAICHTKKTTFHQIIPFVCNEYASNINTLFNIITTHFQRLCKWLVADLFVCLSFLAGLIQEEQTTHD